MSVWAQILRLCTVALLVSLGLGWVRGWPRAQSAKLEAGTCHAPSQVFAAEQVRWISQDEARQLAGGVGVAFVDCRPAPEYEAGHVAGAIHAGPSATLVPQSLLSALAGASTVVTYCDAESQCARSVAMAKELTQAGVRDVRVLEGGLPAWLQHGYPAESGACPQCEAAR